MRGSIQSKIGVAATIVAPSTDHRKMLQRSNRIATLVRQAHRPVAGRPNIDNFQGFPDA
jgi:hypothetical protein